jgi:UDP-N-acetylglucosamine 2-epimerase (non-hydrolysing)
MKLMIVLGTRPEIIRLSEVIKLVNSHCELVLVHTGQNYDYELNQIFFDDLGLPAPHHFLGCSGENPCEVIGQVISRSYDVMRENTPDALLVLGDTNSCLSAYSAKRLKIPIFHMEAGNRCFDQRVPEEINRKIVDTLADVNLPYSQISRSYLISEGFDPSRVIVTGSPMYEVLNANSTRIEECNVLEKFSLEKGNYIVVSVHREENVDNENNFDSVLNGLNQIASKLDKKIIFSAHPRTRSKINKLNFQLDSRIMLSKPLGFFEYNNLQRNSLFVISDSGTIFEESSILSFRAMSLRQTHERPEAFEASGVLLCSPNVESMLSASGLLGNLPIPSEIPIDYSRNNVAEKILKIIVSYVDHVNFYSWHR